MTLKLRQSALSKLPKAVTSPVYDRAALTPGIVHIGVGNFHRAHQAVYLQRLFDLGVGHDWALVGAGVRDEDAAMRAHLQRQDWLSTVVELDPHGLTASICGSMIDFVPVDARSLIDRLVDPSIRIVSLTITEGGYFIDAQTGGFRADHPDVVRDAADPEHPRTVFGILVAALALRRHHNTPPLTVLSCDNLPGNGDIARQTVVGFAEALAPEMADWISRSVAFPNGMVDCITPATTDHERKLVADRFGIEDLSPVTCEPYRQWVLEDTFPQGRPALEEVGVEFVSDVSPHELLKLRVLNGGHAAIAYPSALLGLTYAHEAMTDPLVSGYLRRLQVSEIMPTVPPVPGVDTADYFATVERRFANSAVADTIARLCLDGSNRQPKFILPTIAERLERRQPINGLALEVALWCRYCIGTDEDGNRITVVDEQAERLSDHARRARDHPAAFLEMTDIFGPLAGNPEFRRQFGDALDSLWRDGTRATLRTYLSSDAA